MIDFGEWMPDIASYKNTGVVEAKNVVPISEGYANFLALSVNSTALDSYCRGAFSVKNSASLSFSYAGSGTKLYQLSDGTWTDQSKGSGTYALSSTDYWEFIKWGEKVIAVGGINAGSPIPPQIITIGAVGSTEFADLGGSPPQARHIGVVRDFVVLGNLYESATSYPSRVRWSGVNDETQWSTDASALSDYQDIQGNGGWVQRIVGGSYGTIFLERSLFRMDYIGPPLVFAFNEIEPGVGTLTPNSIIQWGSKIFFLSTQGFQVLSSGGRPVNIGNEKVNKWFFSRWDSNYPERVIGSLDITNNRVIWIFPGESNNSGLPNEGLIYDLISDKWSRFEAEIEFVFNQFGEDYTLEGLDDVTTDLDALAFSLDSPVWVGGDRVLAGFDSSHKSGGFSGTPLDAVIETGERKLNTQDRTYIGRIRPEVEGSGTIALNIGERDSQEDSISWGGNLIKQRDDGYSARSNARYHSFRATISGGFDKALGITIVEGQSSSRF